MRVRRLRSAPGGSLLRNESGVSMESVAEEGACLGAPPAGARLANGGDGGHGAAAAEAAAGPHSPATTGEGCGAGGAMADAGVRGGVPGPAGDPALADMDVDRGARPAQRREDLRCAAAVHAAFL